MLAKWKIVLKKVLPAPLLNLLRTLRNRRDLRAYISFVFNRNLNASLRDRLRIIKQLYVISFAIDSPHTQEEILNYICAILSLPRDCKGVVVEAGCYKGSSTAKFSLAANIACRQLVVFDSFQGIPDNDEPKQRNIFGEPAHFKKGDYCARIDEVKMNVSKYGRIACCRFVEGWFENTLPKFQEPVSAIYLDVDLASSTRTCLKHLYPLLEPGGVLFSQDGHLPLIINVFGDDSFWLNEIGCKKPGIIGLGKSKLIRITKEV
jgi:O-methyltransferase